MSYPDEITAWLQDPDRSYSAGIALLEKNSRNQILARNLKARESDGNFRTLEYQLEQVAKSEPVMRNLADAGFKVPAGSTIVIIQPGTPTGAPAAPATPEQPAPALVLSPEVRSRVDEIATESGKLYTEQARLSNTLADIQDDAQRAAVVKQIEDVKAKRDELAQERRHLEDGGELAPEATAAPSLAELEKKRNNLRSSVSKAKDKAERAGASEEAKAKYAQKRTKLDQLELDIKHVKQQSRLNNG